MGSYQKCIFLFLFIILGVNSVVIGQVKIGGNPSTINVNSVLEIEASDKGLLLPRIALVSTMSVLPLTSTIVAGMTVYNTATIADVVPGFYYYNGTKWIRVADAAAGTATASNGLNNSGGDIKLGGALTSPTTILTDATNTLAFSGLQTGLAADDVLLSSSGVIKKIDAISFLNGVTTVSNTSSINDLSTTVNGKMGSVVPIINSNALSSSVNTLTSTVNGVTGTTAPIVNSNALSVSGTDLTSTVNGVSSTPIDLTSAIASGTTVSNTSTANELTTTVNGKTGSVVSIINSNALSSSVNTLTSTVNGVSGTTAPIINSNALSVNGADLTSTVNGVSSTSIDLTSAIASGTTVSNTSTANELTTTVNGKTGLPVNMINTNVVTNLNGSLVSTVNDVSAPGVPVLISSSNGLTTTSGDVHLGGSLTSPTTTITTSGTNKLALAGLQAGAATDDIITADAAGVLTRSPKSAVPTIYTADGTLTESRTVFQGANSLMFDGTPATGGSVIFDNNFGSSINVLAKDAVNGVANFRLGAGSVSINSNVNSNGSYAQFYASGSSGFSIGTSDVARLGFSTAGSERMSITPQGRVLVENNMIIYNTGGAVGTSGLQFDVTLFNSSSPETAGAGAIGVDNNGNVVRVPTLSSSSNGLTTTAGEVKLGGVLTETTTITQGTNSLRFEGTPGTGGYTRFDNDVGSSIGSYANAPNGRAALALGAGSTAMYSFVDGGSNAQIVAVGSTGFSLGTSDANGVSFNTNNQQRMSISDIGVVAVLNSVEINNTAGAANTSGLTLTKLTSASPESVGGAIGVDGSGNVVRVSTASSPFSAKLSIDILATVSSPAKAPAAENDFVRYRDLGNNQIEVDFLYSATSAGVANGSGDYLFTLPNGYSFNGGENPMFIGSLSTAAEVNSALPYVLRDVKTVFIGSGGSSTSAYVIPYNATQFRLVGISNNQAAGSASNGMANTTAVYGGRFIFVHQ